MSGMSAVVKGRTLELLVSFARFGLEGVLLFGPFLFVVMTGFWFSARGSFSGALTDVFGGSVFFTDIFDGGVFLVFERGGIMFAITHSPQLPLLNHMLLRMCHYSY